MVQKRILQIGRGTIVLIILGVFFYSGWRIAGQKKEARECEATYQKLSVFVHKEPERSADRNHTDGDEERVYEINAHNFAELKKENPDLKGWIKIDGTSIDYPVMQLDNSFYLKHGFNRENSRYGVPFLDERSQLEEDRFLIYGHHMKDGSMFYDLTEYKDKDFIKNHKNVTWYTEDREYLYRVFCVCEADVEKNQTLYQEILVGKTGITKQWLEENTTKLYYFEQSNEVQNEHYMVLITCAYTTENGRLLVFAEKDRKDIDNEK